MEAIRMSRVRYECYQRPGTGTLTLTRDLPTLGAPTRRSLARERGRRRRQVRLPGYILSLIMRQLQRVARQRDCPRVEIYVLLARRRARPSRAASRPDRPAGLDIIVARRPGFRNPVSAATITATTLRESPTCLETRSSASAIVRLTRTTTSAVASDAAFLRPSAILREIPSIATFSRPLTPLYVKHVSQRALFL